MGRRPVALSVAVAVALALLLLPGTASAAWRKPGTGAGAAAGSTMPVGGQPTTSKSGHNVTVSWTAATLVDGTNVTGYRVARYASPSGTPQTVGASCVGTIGALTCTEQAVPTGAWYYTVAPRQSAWIGGESAASADVVIAAPSLVFTSSTNLSTLPSALAGTIASFLTGETVTWRLDNPSTGTILSGSITPDPVPASGTSSISVTIAAGLANGVHQVYAVGSLGSQANASINVNIPDTTSPTVTAAAIGKTTGGATGRIAQGDAYYVYANASDPGISPSGVASVTADASALTGGQTAVPLVAGAYTAGGVTYGYRSAAITSDFPLAEGTRSFTVTATDGVGNTGSATYSVTVDNTAPAASDVQTTNAGVAGRAETGDGIVFTYSEAMDPDSILAGWNGTATTVTVRLVQNPASDRVQIFDAANATLLPLGTLRLQRTDYAVANVTFTGSTMTMSGTTVTVVLGTPSGAVGTAAGTATMRWTAATGATDLAGNACATGNVNESGAADVDF